MIVGILLTSGKHVQNNKSSLTLPKYWSVCTKQEQWVLMYMCLGVSSLSLCLRYSD